MAKKTNGTAATLDRPRKKSTGKAKPARTTVDIATLQANVTQTLDIEAQAAANLLDVGAALDAARTAYADARYAFVQANQASLQAQADLVFALIPPM